jgi:hypothetical protein
VEKRLHVCFEVTVRVYISVARIRLVKIENPSECVTVNRKICRSAVAL